MKKNLRLITAALVTGLMLSACSNSASSDDASSAASEQTEESAAGASKEASEPSSEEIAPYEKDENGAVIVERDTVLPFGKTMADVEKLMGSSGEEGDGYVDENEVEYETVDYSMIWFDYENPIVTCFTFMEGSLVKLDLEMDQHVTKELAREIMTNYYGEADETQISDYGTICIWEDQDNDRRFVLIPDESDHYTVEITSLSDKMSSSVRTEISVLDPEASADITGEFASFQSMDLDMNPVDQNILKGHKLTMINVWGTFCGPCLSEMPYIGELNTEYADQGFQVLGIVTDVVNQDGTVSDSQIAVAKEYAEKTGATYTHMLPTIDLYNILLKDVTGVPTTVFVDEGGNILKEVIGAQDKEQWKAVIEELLKA